MQLTEINLVVADLARSHVFYTALGWEMRAITFPDSAEPQAWLTTSGPTPVTLHSVSFAGWWDPSGPLAVPGSTTIDLTLDGDDAAGFLQTAIASGGALIAGSRPMPWGQNYAIVTDPDGYRWGIKSPIST